MAKRKTHTTLSSIIFLILGLLAGFAYSIFASLPASFIIPQTVTTSTPPQSTSSINVDVVKSKDLSVHFLELGNKYTGDCTFINVGETEVLIDAGSKASSIETIHSYISPYVDGALDYVVVTHAHEDHYAGFATNESTQSLFDLYTVGTIIEFAKTNKSESNRLHANYIRERNAEVEAGAKCFTALECWNESVVGGNQAQKIFNLGNNVSLEILYQKFYEENATTENDYSVCLMINQNNEKHYLFTGDLEKDGEKSLVDSNTLPVVDVYKAGHHGSGTSSTDYLLSVIKPKVVCVCCCAGSSEYTSKPENQFPTQKFINNVTKYTQIIYVTSLCEDYKAAKFTSFNGTIVIHSNNGASFNVSCSHSNVLLPESEWFKKNRTLPEAIASK